MFLEYILAARHQNPHGILPSDMHESGSNAHIYLLPLIHSVM